MYKKVVILFTVVIILIMIFMNTNCKVSPGGKEVNVGNKNFTEQYIIGELIKQLLEDRNFTINMKSGRSTPCLREGMEFGDIDIYAEYTGTAWMVHLAHEYNAGMDNNEVYQMVKEEEVGNGIIWLKPIWNNNTYALASWPEFAGKYGLKNLSDLASLYREKQGEIKTCVGLEFSTRRDGMPALEQFYDFEVDESFMLIKAVEIPQITLRNRMSEVAMVFGTDAEVIEFGWYLYEDDKSFFPPYDLTPCIRKEILEKYPEIENILNELADTFPGGGHTATPEIVAQCQKVWQELNAKIDTHKMRAADAAREYLIEHGLIKG